MIRLMYSGVSGMRNHQLRMDVVGNNISNVNTTAYKAGRANFQDTLYQTMGAAGSGGYQVGTGVSVAGISNNFNTGAPQETGRSMDVAIMGNGFYGVLDDNDKLKFTRDGSFFVDKDGNLVTSGGLRVVDSDEDAITLDIENGQSLDDLAITKNGEILIEKDSYGTIGLFNFTNVSGLTREGDNLFLENESTGDRYSNEDESEAFGEMRSGYLEMSNIDISQEMTYLITSQRAFQANARVFTTADEILQETVQLKR